jgi:hypothetical protein
MRNERYRPMPPAIIINKGLSQPANPEKPSLLNLAAEIRNEIYGWHFMRYKPIIYTSSDREPDFYCECVTDDEGNERETKQASEEGSATLRRQTHDIGPA